MRFIEVLDMALALWFLLASFRSVDQNLQMSILRILYAIFFSLSIIVIEICFYG